MGWYTSFGPILVLILGEYDRRRLGGLDRGGGFGMTGRGMTGRGMTGDDLGGSGSGIKGFLIGGWGSIQTIPSINLKNSLISSRELRKNSRRG